MFYSFTCKNLPWMLSFVSFFFLASLLPLEPILQPPKIICYKSYVQVQDFFFFFFL
jgi:hypothetical protein